MLVAENAESLIRLVEREPKTAGYRLPLYTAFVLWAVGAVIIAVSTLYPRLVTTLLMGLLWSLTATRLAYREGVGKQNPAYQLSYVIHFSSSQHFVGTPWSVSFVVVSVVLLFALFALFAGAWRLRRVDL